MRIIPGSKYYQCERCDSSKFLSVREAFSLYWPFIYQGKAVEFWSMDWNVAKRWATGSGGIMRPWGLSASLFVNPIAEASRVLNVE